jgi:alanyl-tRNA synthetase
VARTGAIGIIAVASWDKFRGGTRVEFLCGIRALRGYAVLRDAVAASVRLVSVLPGELPAGIERLQADARDTKRIVKDLQLRLASFEAEALAARAQTRGALRLVVESLAGWDANGLKTLASAIAERPGYVVGLFSLPPPAAVVIACAPDAGVDCAGILKRLTEKFGGKGGGRAQFAQGGGLQGAIEDMRAFVEAAMLAM